MQSSDFFFVTTICVINYYMFIFIYLHFLIIIQNLYTNLNSIPLFVNSYAIIYKYAYTVTYV